MGWIDATSFYKSGDKPKYKVGDTVFKTWRYYDETIKKYVELSCEHIVENVSSEKSGFIFSEFTYKVRNKHNNELVEDVYESELSTECKGVKYKKKFSFNSFVEDYLKDENIWFD
jgi:hypothetical protein